VHGAARAVKQRQDAVSGRFDLATVKTRDLLLDEAIVLI
jgi:hypothetical protein